MQEDSQKYTAFVTEDGQYEFVRIPFGLKNAPSYFQKIMSTVVLAGLNGISCFVYVDDIITFGAMRMIC